MTTATSMMFLLLAAVTDAQFFNTTSRPFRLVLTSNDTTINNSTLSACHTGAALESLCLSIGGGISNPDPIAAATFNFNTSTSSFPANDTFGTPGILTWLLNASNIEVPSSLYFNYDPSTDIALPLLTPGSENPQLLAFDDQDRMNVQGSIDWTENPPNVTTTTVAYYRWYACQTYFLGYSYHNLAWGLGAEIPENPTCVSVGVRRVFE